LIREDEIESKDASRVLPFRRLIRNRTMPFFIIQQVTSAGADFIYVALTGSYFLNEYELTTAQAGLLISLPLWGGALGGVAGGLLNDLLIKLTGSRRWSRSLVGFTGKMMACLIMFVALAQTSGLMAAILLFVVKFFSDWSQPTVWGTCSDIGGRYTATVFSIINTAGSIGGILTPLVVGRILDYYSTTELVDGAKQVVTNYNPAFVLVAALYCVSALTWFLIDCTKRIEA
jgi:nitrate/nitrite transporter NarK